MTWIARGGGMHNAWWSVVCTHKQPFFHDCERTISRAAMKTYTCIICYTANWAVHLRLR
jgi:hypothetical protein